MLRLFTGKKAVAPKGDKCPNIHVKKKMVRGESVTIIYHGQQVGGGGRGECNNNILWLTGGGGGGGGKV